MLAHEFMRNALFAGTFIALACGSVGYFVVLRGQVFAGDALGHVAFTGALAAAAAGIDIRLGIFAATIAIAIAVGAIGERSRPDDVVIGSVFAWVLGLGALCLSIFTEGGSGSNGTAGVRVLFGSILGLSHGQAMLAAAIAAAVLVALVAIARPLLFSSVDAQVARGLGLPVRALGIGFLILLAVVAAEATQAVGALLLLGLLAAPGGAARLLTDSLWRGMGLSTAIAVVSMWSGLSLSYQLTALPPSSAVIGVATGFFGMAVICARFRSRREGGLPLQRIGQGAG